jgi:hypothetical protein
MSILLFFFQHRHGCEREDKEQNIKARLDIALFCNRKNMELVLDWSQVAKPRAHFMLEKNAQLLVYKWLKSLRFPDRHASNISRLVNMEE